MEELAVWDVLLRTLPGSLRKHPSWLWRGTVCGCRADRRQFWKAPRFWEEGWEASALVVCTRGPHSEDTGTQWVSPLPAHRLLTGPVLRDPALGRGQPVCPSVGSPLWIFMLPFTLLLPLPSFSFLFLFSFSSTFVFLSFLDYSHFSPLLCSCSVHFFHLKIWTL